jgi:hypothetical protein
MEQLARFKVTFGLDGIFHHSSNWEEFKKSFDKGELDLSRTNCNYRYDCKSSVHWFMDQLTEDDLKGITKVNVNLSSDHFSSKVFVGLFRKLNPANLLELHLGNNHSWNKSLDPEERCYMTHIFRIALELGLQIKLIHAHESDLDDGIAIRDYLSSPYSKMEFLNVLRSKCSNWTAVMHGILHSSLTLKELYMDLFYLPEEAKDLYLDFIRNTQLVEKINTEWSLGDEFFSRLCQAMIDNPFKPFRNVKFYHNEVTSISPLIPILPYLESLQWSNNIGPDFELAVAGMYNLKSLWIGVSGHYDEPKPGDITSEQVNILFQTLKSSRNIEKIRVYGPNLKGVVSISSFIRENRSIRNLYFKKNLDVEVLFSIADAMISIQSSLRFLSIEKHLYHENIKQMIQRAKRQRRHLDTLYRELKEKHYRDSVSVQALGIDLCQELIMESLPCIAEDFVLEERMYY